MKRAIAFLLVLPLTGLAGADTLIIPKDRSVEKSAVNDFFLFQSDKKVQIYETNDPRTLLKKLKPVVTEPYPQQIIKTEPASFPQHRREYNPHPGYND
jgi:hypothetical protein